MQIRKTTSQPCLPCSEFYSEIEAPEEHIQICDSGGAIRHQCGMGVDYRDSRYSRHHLGQGKGLKFPKNRALPAISQSAAPSSAELADKKNPMTHPIYCLCTTQRHYWALTAVI